MNESCKKIKIGLIGLGTVGAGVYKILRAQDKQFSNVEVVRVAVRDVNKPRNIDNFDYSILTADPYEVVNNSEIDIVVELAGGIEPALDLLKTAIKNGKHIVTANKELLAKNGEELFNLAREYNRVILYEAAIGGGIPIIMPVKTILAGNKITGIEAILNGTTNYILTKMDVEGASYENVLKEAQALGYAEADPSGDVEGFDAVYKITTLAALAFRHRVRLQDVYREGITGVRAEDMKTANELGYKIKLVASARTDENGADVRVHPMLVPKNHALAHIDYVTNAVTLSGHPIGQVTLSGPGAGEFPTASSVIGDILAIAAEINTTDYILPMMRCIHDSTIDIINILDTTNKYYLSISTSHCKGVIGKIGTICANNNISLASVVQKEVCKNNYAEITVITEKTLEKNMRKAIQEMEQDESIHKVNSLIRVWF